MNLSYSVALAALATILGTSNLMAQVVPGLPQKTPILIYDNDGNEALFGLETPLVDSHLAKRVAQLAGTEVDAIYYCTNAGFGTCARRSKVWKPLVDKPETYPNNALQALFDLGTDPLEITVEFAHRHGIEIFENIRMNDIHDKGSDAMGKWRFSQNDFKQQHPEFLLGSPKRLSKSGGWSAVNYAIPEVRQHVFRYVAEGCQNYDIDGVHLDFFRHPVFFKSTYQGKLCTDAERLAMTELIREIRRKTQEIAKSKGRAMAISIRVPDSLDYCHAIGLDLHCWLEENLIDRLTTSSYFKLNEWPYTVNLASKHSVVAIPSLDEPRVKDPVAQAARRTPASYRGRVLNAFASGANGVLLFNPFDVKAMQAATSPKQLWNELGSVEHLQRTERHYFASPRGRVNANGGNLSYADYQHTEVLNPNNPTKLDATASQNVSLFIAEGSTANSKDLRQLTLRFSQPAQISVSLNGHIVSGEWIKESYWQGELSSNAFLPGANKISVAIVDSSINSISWLDAQVTIRPIVPPIILESPK
jgi:hypothetical protein